MDKFRNGFTIGFAIGASISVIFALIYPATQSPTIQVLQLRDYLPQELDAKPLNHWQLNH
jgi:hypothetical protein